MISNVNPLVGGPQDNMVAKKVVQFSGQANTRLYSPDEAVQTIGARDPEVQHQLGRDWMEQPMQEVMAQQAEPELKIVQK